jgi:hypothetical protein
MIFKLPFERYTLISPLPPAEIKTRLQKQTSGSFVLNSKIMKTFSGDFAGNAFLISRVNEKKGYKKKSMTAIKGRILNNGTGSIIIISMGLSLFTYLIFGFVLLGLSAYIIANGGISLKQPLTLGVIGIPVVFIWFWVNFLKGVESEKLYLSKLFEGTEISD